MSEIRFVYNGTLPDAAADKIIESVLDALSVVDDAAVAFHDKDKNRLRAFDSVKVISNSAFKGMIGEIVSVDRCYLPYAVQFKSYEQGVVRFLDSELELVESADDA